MWQAWAILAGARNGRHPEDGLLGSIAWAGKLLVKLFLVFCLIMGGWAIYANHKLSVAQDRYDTCVKSYGATYTVVNDYGMTPAEKYLNHWYNRNDDPCGENPSSKPKY